MTGPLLGVALLLLIAATALLLVLTLGITRRAQLVVGIYVLGFAEVVVLTLFLSAFDAFSRGVLIAAVAFVFVAALGVWWLRGMPSAPSWRWRLERAVVPAPVLFLSVAVVLSIAYVFALIVGTPPNGWDPLNYHLARAAFWVQSHHVGYIGDAYDQRLNFNPPNAEIGMAFLLSVTRTERSAGFVQFLALLSSGVGVFAFARRIGRSHAEALCGALLFMLTPIVLLQSSGAKNDVVVASFLVAAAVFVVGRTRGELCLAGLATGLAIGAKFTAAYGLVVLGGLALAAGMRDRRPWRLVAIALGALAGSYWYVVNASETGRFLGDQSGTGTLTAPFDPKPNVVTAYGDALDTVDLSGAKGKDILIYLIAGVVLAAAIALRRHWGRALAAGVVVAIPLALLPLSKLGRSGLVDLYDALHRPPGYLAIGDAVASSATTASDTASWFGPAGFLLMLAAPVLLSRRALLVALAPFVWLVLVAVTLTYHPWQGRFFVFPVALSAALWGGVLARGAAAWGAAALAVVTAFLSLVHYVEKPSGLQLIEPRDNRSVWRMTRAEVQSLHDPALEPVLRFMDRTVPRHASIGLALGPNEFAFPAFGPNLTRRVVLVPSGSSARDLDVPWLYADAERAAQIDNACWEPRLESERGVVFQRAAACPASA